MLNVLHLLYCIGICMYFTNGSQFYSIWSLDIKEWPVYDKSRVSKIARFVSKKKRESGIWLVESFCTLRWLLSSCKIPFCKDNGCQYKQSFAARISCLTWWRTSKRSPSFLTLDTSLECHIQVKCLCWKQETYSVYLGELLLKRSWDYSFRKRLTKRIANNLFCLVYKSGLIYII